MPLYNRGMLPATASVLSPEYRTAAFQHYLADVEPIRRQAMQELMDEYSARGLTRSGLAEQARLMRQGDFLQRLAQQRQQLGLQQAGLTEEERQRLESRAWQLEDIARQQALEDELSRQEAEDYETARRMGYIGTLAGGIGRLGGSLIGGLYGKQKVGDNVDGNIEDTTLEKPKEKEVERRLRETYYL